MSAKKSKKMRKMGRNATFCSVYRNEQRAEKSKLRRLQKHAVRFPDDHCALGAIGRLKVILRGHIIQETGEAA